MLNKIAAHVAAKIAISENASQFSLVINDAKTAASLLRHDDKGIGHLCGRPGKRQGFSFPHDVRDMLQLGPKFSAGMELAEILGGETLVFEKRYGQSVAQGQLQKR